MAQNWNPVLVNEKMNYQYTTADYISNTIWADSAGISGNDSVFYFNRVVTGHPINQEMMLRNQPQFLLKQMTRLDSGVYVFTDPGSFTIRSLANVGSIWTFDLEDEIESEVTAIDEIEFFGVSDSVKTISLSNGNEIWLSKSFGIVQFPYFDGSGNYELVGIQDTEFGESVPDFWDIFDFEVGDVFQRVYTYDYYSLHSTTKMKFMINSKEINIDNVNYNVSTIISYYNAYGDHYTDSYLDTLNYYLADFSKTNKFQHELILLENYPCGPIYSYPNLFSKNIAYIDTNGIISKRWGTNLGVTYSNLFYDTDPPGDTLIKLGSPECTCEEPHGISYAKSLGITSSYYNNNYNEIDFFVLEGYIKDGDTVGTITSDSLLLVGIDSHNFNKNSNYSIYPNPATKWITIKNLNSFNNDPFSFEILNLQGVLVKEEKNIKSKEFTMDVGDLPTGLYLYTIKNDNQVVQQGKLIIQ